MMMQNPWLKALLLLLIGGGLSAAAVGAAPGERTDGFITGLVFDAAGTPLRGVAVTAIDVAGRPYTAQSTPQGFYAVSVPPGIYQLQVSAAGYIEAQRVGLLVDANAVLMHVDFMLPLGGVLVGSVFQLDGATPLKGARVTALLQAGSRPARATASSDGSFTLEGMPAGRYAVRVTAPGFNPASRDVELAAGQAAGHMMFTLDRAMSQSTKR